MSSNYSYPRLSDHPSRQVYRYSNLGQALIQTLNEMQMNHQIDKNTANRILATFDKSFCKKLDSLSSNLPKAKVLGEVDSYQRLFDTWKFIIMDGAISIENEEEILEGKLKLFATKKEM